MIPFDRTSITLLRLPVLAAAASLVAGFAAGAAIGPQLSGRQLTASASPIALENVPVARGSHPAEVLRVIDGDTFEARVRVWPGLEITTKVRLRGIDAPEVRARCPQERSKAQAARDALRLLLAEDDVALARVSLDKYGGRVLADVATGKTADVASALLQAGLVRKYSGGRRESWCNRL